MRVQTTGPAEARGGSLGRRGSPAHLLAPDSPLVRPLATATAVLLGAALWQAISWMSGGWVPSVGVVLSATMGALQSPAFYGDALVTLQRVAIIMGASTVLGFAVGLVAGLSRTADQFLRPLLVTGLAIPDPVYVIMGILILGVSWFSGIAAVTVAITPLVANVVLSSVQDRNRGLDEMAFTYGFSWIDYLRHVVLWQIMPAVIAAVQTAFAFSWKLVVLLEALAADDGVGAHIYEAFQLLRPDEMIAYALIFIALMRVIEGVAFAPLARKATRWSTS